MSWHCCCGHSSAHWNPTTSSIHVRLPLSAPVYIFPACWSGLSILSLPAQASILPGWGDGLFALSLLLPICDFLDPELDQFVAGSTSRSRILDGVGSCREELPTWSDKRVFKLPNTNDLRIPLQSLILAHFNQIVEERALWALPHSLWWLIVQNKLYQLKKINKMWW